MEINIPLATRGILGRIAQNQNMVFTTTYEALQEHKYKHLF